MKIQAFTTQNPIKLLKFETIYSVSHIKSFLASDRDDKLRKSDSFYYSKNSYGRAGYGGDVGWGSSGRFK